MASFGLIDVSDSDGPDYEGIVCDQDERSREECEDADDDMGFSLFGASKERDAKKKFKKNCESLEASFARRAGRGDGGMRSLRKGMTSQGFGPAGAAPPLAQMSSLSKSAPVEKLSSIYRLPPFYYMHVLDMNTNVTRLEVGPQTFVRNENNTVVLEPREMFKLAPRHYVVIANPAIKDENGDVVLNQLGQVQLAHGDYEIVFTRPPFPLYPGESLYEGPAKLQIIDANRAAILKAVLDFTDDAGNKRVAGDSWLFEGPGTYIPRKEVQIVGSIKAHVIKPNEALRLRAERSLVDRGGVRREPGEEWLVTQHGTYLPGIYETVVKKQFATVLNDKVALHLRASRTFKDQFGKVRKNGDEWLITQRQADAYITGVNEVLVKEVPVTTLTSRQYCIVLNPVDEKTHKPKLGGEKLIKGPVSFFLQPGESLAHGIQDVYILGENEGVKLYAREAFKDEMGIMRAPGDKWIIRGPAEYVPVVEVVVQSIVTAIPLDKNEGIYVRNTKTGKIRAIIGQTYMLDENEELWEKDLPDNVESLLGYVPISWAEQPRGARRGGKIMRSDDEDEQEPMQAQINMSSNIISAQFAPAQYTQMLTLNSARTINSRVETRDKTRVVTYRVPHNGAVQVYNYQEKKARVLFGPELVMLGPDEHFTQLSLSGGRPKVPNQIKTLCMLLGPDFCTDVVTVETADHARLKIQLAYNWHFPTTDKSEQAATKLFSVPDFIGDACKAMASRVRGVVAQVQFDTLHKNSARIIRSAIFGQNTAGKMHRTFTFDQNGMVITSVDIQAVEPIDQRTRDALQKSVQLAIEITIQSQEAQAKQEAQRLEQEAKGKLERQRISDQSEAEKTRKELLELQAQSAAVESTGQAKAEAESRAQATTIECQAMVEQAELARQAKSIDAECELDRLTKARAAELEYQQRMDIVELRKKTQLGQIESSRFAALVSALGANTIRSLAQAGPEHQVRLLQSLGIQSTLITDGNTPINLLQTAHGLIEHQPMKKSRIDV